MPTLQNLSIRHKQTLIIMLTSSLALLLACLAFVVCDTITFRQQLVARETSVAEVIGSTVSAAIDFGDRDTAEESLAALKAEPNVASACIYGRNGEVFADYHRQTRQNQPAFPRAQAEGNEFTGGQLHLFLAIKQKNQVVGTLFLASDLNELSIQVDRYWWIVGLVFITSLLGAFGLSSRLQRVVSDPIIQLSAQTARSVALDKNYSVRVARQGSDELGQLIDGFNAMLDQIQQRDADLQTIRDGLEIRVRERTKELDASLSVLNATLSSTADGILVVNNQGRKIFQNRRTAELWGIPQTIAEGENDKAQIQFVKERTMNPEEFVEKVQYYYAHPDEEGQELITLKNGTLMDRITAPVLGKDGTNHGRIWTFRDVTKQKQAETELAYERDLLRALMDNSPDHIYFKDLQSRFIKSSHAQARQFGMQSATSLVGKSDFEFFTEEHARPAFEEEQEIIRTGRPMIGRVEKEVWKDGRPTSWVLTTKMPLSDQTGRIIGTFGISKDITALKLTEAELSYERDLLKAFLDHCPDSIYFKDRQSRFVRLSRSKLEKDYVAMTNKFQTDSGTKGLPAHLASLENFSKYALGRTDFDFHQEKIARQMFEEEQEIMRTGTALVGKLNHIELPDGQVAWGLTTKMPWRGTDGEILGTFGITKDITFIKQAEAEVEAAHKQLLEISRQAGMAEVATNVLHNVGNVLNSVNVSAALVLEITHRGTVAYVGKAAKMLQGHAGDLGEFMTNDPRGRQLPGFLSQLARQLADEQVKVAGELDLLGRNIEHIKEIVAMQQSYAKFAGLTETVQVSELVEDALRMNAGALARHEIKLVREFTSAPPISVEKHKVLQILVNLIRNAKYACDEGGRNDKRITVQIAATGHGVRIAVLDNGVGIPPENVTLIFNHGFTTRRGGHGFGLHSGALAARELGGGLTVHSDGPGQGATFTLNLPLQPPKPTS